MTAEAIAPFRIPAMTRPEGDPKPLPYLTSAADQKSGGIDLHLELHLSSARMREQGIAPMRLTRTNLKDLYWTPAQMVTHHTSNGCNLMPGDFIGTGTVSGPTPDSLGSLLEITKRGAQPLELPTGEQRKFIEDGDEIVIRGYCEREGGGLIGFGECRAVITPAL